MEHKSLFLGILLGTFCTLGVGMILVGGSGILGKYSQGIDEGRIEIFTGQVICRQAPLQGIEIQLECKSRKEIEDFLRFI